MEPEIQPLTFYEPGCCIECNGQLTIVDMETTFLKLSPSASPVSEDTVIKVEAVCTRCGKRYPMMRDGLYYVHDNSYTRILKQYKHSKYCRDILDRMEGLKPKEDNPFCINVKENS